MKPSPNISKFLSRIASLNLPVNVAAAAAPSAAADAFSPSATVTCFLKLAGDDLLDFEAGRDSVSSSMRRPTI